MLPYHPCVSSVSVSGFKTWAYDGCRSSRRGGWTLTSGASPLTARSLPLELAEGAEGLKSVILLTLCCKLERLVDLLCNEAEVED